MACTDSPPGQLIFEKEMNIRDSLFRKKKIPIIPDFPARIYRLDFGGFKALIVA